MELGNTAVCELRTLSHHPKSPPQSFPLYTDWFHQAFSIAHIQEMKSANISPSCALNWYTIWILHADKKKINMKVYSFLLVLANLDISCVLWFKHILKWNHLALELKANAYLTDVVQGYLMKCISSTSQSVLIEVSPAYSQKQGCSSK